MAVLMKQLSRSLLLVTVEAKQHLVLLLLPLLLLSLRMLLLLLLLLLLQLLLLLLLSLQPLRVLLLLPRLSALPDAFPHGHFKQAGRHTKASSTHCGSRQATQMADSAHACSHACIS